MLSEILSIFIWDFTYSISGCKLGYFSVNSDMHLIRKLERKLYIIYTPCYINYTLAEVNGPLTSCHVHNHFLPKQYPVKQLSTN